MSRIIPTNIAHDGQHGYRLLNDTDVMATGETRLELTWWLDSQGCAGLDKGCDMVASAIVLPHIPREYGDGVPFPWFQPIVNHPAIPTYPTIPVDPQAPEPPLRETPEPGTAWLLCIAVLMFLIARVLRGDA